MLLTLMGVRKKRLWKTHHYHQGGREGAASRDRGKKVAWGVTHNCTTKI